MLLGQIKVTRELGETFTQFPALWPENLLRALEIGLQ